MRDNVTIPGALAVALIAGACTFFGTTMASYFKDSGANAQHRDDLRDLKGMRDREVDSMTQRILALESRCRP